MRHEAGTETRHDAGPDAREREFAGRIAGALWIAGAGAVGGLLVVPGTDVEDPALALTLSALGLTWGLLCAFAIPWERWRSPLLFHVPALVCLPYLGVATAATGGASSPVWLAGVMLVAFCCYFFPADFAVFYALASIGVVAAPLAYDSGATEAGLPGQLFLAVPMILSVAAVFVLGKRKLVDLRDHAEHESLHDALTGLPNRRALTELLEERVGGARASDRLALMIVDLDDFKDANTMYGMPGGDAVLAAAADALQVSMRDGDLVARLGGDEFAVVVFGAGQVELNAIARRTLRSLAATGATLGEQLPGFKLHASVGWARHPEDASSVDELIALADLSLRSAKAAGKGGWQSPHDWQPETTSA
jgi:diguanylate cyclase (GGDEF)-like protein